MDISPWKLAKLNTFDMEVGKGKINMSPLLQESLC